VWEKCRIEEEKIWLFGPWPKRRSVVGGHEWHGVVLHTVWPPIATTLCGQREGVFFFFSNEKSGHHHQLCHCVSCVAT